MQQVALAETGLTPFG